MIVWTHPRDGFGSGYAGEGSTSITDASLEEQLNIPIARSRRRNAGRSPEWPQRSRTADRAASELWSAAPVVAEGGDVLYYFLYICKREDATVGAAKFVGHLTSGRGQRQIEWANFLPARQVSRDIRSRRDPPNR